MMAMALQYYPPSEVLGASELLYEPWSSLLNDKIDRLLDYYLKPTNMRIHVTSPEEEMPAFFASAEDVESEPEALAAGMQQMQVGERAGDGAGDGEEKGTGVGGSGGGEEGEWEVDPWYGTRYRVRQVPGALVNKAGDWFTHLTGAGARRVSLPPPNKYISVDSAVLPAAAEHSLTPKQVLDTPTIKAWHLLDVSLAAPRASIFLSLHSPVVDTSARAAALLRLLLEVLELRVNEQRYMAEEAGLSIDITNFSFTSPCYGLRLLLHGFSGNLHLLLADVTSTLAELSISQDVFDMAKEKAETDYKNRKFQQPFLHAMISNHRVLEQPFFSDEARLAALQVQGLRFSV